MGGAEEDRSRNGKRAVKRDEGVVDVGTSPSSKLYPDEVSS